KSLPARINTISADIRKLNARLSALPANGEAYKKVKNDIAKKELALNDATKELATWGTDNFEKLSAESKSLFRKAFTNNEGDPFYRELTSLDYTDDGASQQVAVPKGDVLHQFRQDVNSGRLPTVSWI